MKQLPDYGDERQYAWCIHCGGDTSTRDHIPSKVFLDEPYPDNLPVVPACRNCNESFSKDEEYVACLVECAIAGSLPEIRREKIKKIMNKKTALAARLEQARKVESAGISFTVENDRVAEVLLKLGRGHVLFELNERCSGPPGHFAFQPIHLMSVEARQSFEEPPDHNFLPEVGSRALQRVICGGPDYEGGWVTVQPGRYRYLASPGTLIRIVISEYLACEIGWLD